MNFPGLDPAWSGWHRTLHQTGLLRTWSLAECRAALGQGERVLVVSSIALGDTLLCTPLLTTLAHQLGAERVAFLVKKPLADLYAGDPRLHQVFTVRGKYRWENLRRELARRPHRLALLANVTEPDLIPFLHRCGVRGFLRYRSRWCHYPRWIANREMLRQPGDRNYATGHAIENNLAMAEALGLVPQTHALSLPHLTRSDKKEPYLLLHPGASRPNKIWTVEKWTQVATALLREYPFRLALTGSTREIPLVQAILTGLSAADRSRTEIVAGKLSLRQLAQLQARAALFLSGDTGPYHLAVAVGCPTVTLFAPTDRGSSAEACGPHQADPVRHRVLSTRTFGDSIADLTPTEVIACAAAVLNGAPL